MVWPFTLTHNATFSGLVKAPVSKAIQLLHDPKALINLNPLVVGTEQSSTDPNLYTITDKLKILCFSFNINYTGTFTSRDDGVDSVVDAGVGTTLTSKWRAEESNEGTNVSEAVTVKALFFIMPFVLSSLDSSHNVLHERLAAELEGRSPDAPAADQAGSSRLATAPVYLLLSLLFLTCHWTLDGIWKTVSFSVLAVCTSLVSFLGKSRDPYGTFHYSLNETSGSAPGSIPKTEWLNMGYWKHTESFPEACEALALKLLEVAKCEPGGKVLDVGHGSGDSLLLHFSHPSVPRPSHLTGITSLRAHYERSLQRVRETQAQCGYNAQKSIINVTLYHGDAVYHPSAAGHPLDTSSLTPPYNTILALDCAYHFRTRHDFLQQSFLCLSPGGRIALADICFSDEDPGSSRNALIKYFIGLLGVMPKENMVTIREYIRDLEDIGYVDVKMEDISADVFPGFRWFLGRRGLGWRIFAVGIGWLYGAGARFVVISGMKPVATL